MEWYSNRDQKVCLNLMNKRSIVCDCTHEEKINFEGFTQKWLLSCYSNQPQTSEVVFYGIDTNTSCTFTKQDLTVKEGYHVSFMFRSVQ